MMWPSAPWNSSARPRSPDASLENTAHVPDVAAIAACKNEAAAARNEMLEGLARLRRELEAQRAQGNTAGTASRGIGLGNLPSTPLTDSGSSIPRFSTLLQASTSGADSIVTSLRKEVEAHQAALAALRLDFATKQDLSDKRAAVMDEALEKVLGELEQLKEQQPLPSRPSDEISHSLRQVNATIARSESAMRGEMDTLKVAVEELQRGRGSSSAAQGTPAKLEDSVAQELREELRELSDRLANLEQKQGTHAAEAVSHLEELSSQMCRELAEVLHNDVKDGCNAVRNELAARMDALEAELKVEGGRVANPGAAPTLPGSLHTRLSAIEAQAQRNSRAVEQLSEVLTLAQSITDKVMEQMTREASAIKASEDKSAAKLSAAERRLTSLENLVGKQVQGSLMEDIARLSEAKDTPTQALFTHELRDSLEKLVDRVARTLEPSGPSSEKSQPQASHSATAGGALSGSGRYLEGGPGGQQGGPRTLSPGLRPVLPRTPSGEYRGHSPTQRPVLPVPLTGQACSGDASSLQRGRPISPTSPRVVARKGVFPVGALPQVVAGQRPLPQAAPVKDSSHLPSLHEDSEIMNELTDELSMSNNSKEFFLKCLEDLKQENQYLREGLRQSSAPGGNGQRYPMTQGSAATISTGSSSGSMCVQASSPNSTVYGVQHSPHTSSPNATVFGGQQPQNLHTSGQNAMAYPAAGQQMARSGHLQGPVPFASPQQVLHHRTISPSGPRSLSPVQQRPPTARPMMAQMGQPMQMHQPTWQRQNTTG